MQALAEADGEPGFELDPAWGRRVPFPGMGELAYWGASVLDVAASREIWQPRRCLLDRPSASLLSRPSVLSTLQAAWRAKLLSAPVQHAARGRKDQRCRAYGGGRQGWGLSAVCCRRRAPVVCGPAMLIGCWWVVGTWTRFSR